MAAAVSINFIFVLLMITLMLTVAYYYWKFYMPLQGDRRRPQQAPVERSDRILSRVKPMYRPRKVGQPTGKKRVFLVSRPDGTKQLRSYEVNHLGLPLPTS